MGIKDEVAEIIRGNKANPMNENKSTRIHNLYLSAIEGVRAEAIGWMYAHACAELDKGNDLRDATVPDILKQAEEDLPDIKEKL